MSGGTRYGFLWWLNTRQDNTKCASGPVSGNRAGNIAGVAKRVVAAIK